MAMWDPVGQCLRYLHGEEGIDDEFVTLRKLVVEGELELPEDALNSALHAGEQEGLSSTVPPSAYGQFGGTLVATTEPTALGCGLPQPKVPAILDVQPSSSHVMPIVSPEMLSTIASQLAIKDGPPTAQQMLLPLFMQALTQKAEAVPLTEPAATAKATVHKKTVLPKDVTTLLFNECNFGGRKLDGMLRNSESILRQANDPTNAWHWAHAEAKKLQVAMDSVVTIAEKSQEAVQTSSLKALQKQGAQDAHDFLIEHKAALTSASKTLGEPLAELVAMHKAKLNSREPAVKKAKKAER
jgi:hypothetical protein